MLDLLKDYSVQDIFIFIVLLALSLKGCVSFFDWIGKRLHRAIDKAEKPDRLQKDIEQSTQEIEELKKSLEEITKMIHMLIDSDKDAIKAFITKEHHLFCYEKGWIDDYSLDCIERRYSHYEDQGGNSFIKNLVMQLRRLPRRASAYEKEQQHVEDET